MLVRRALVFLASCNLRVASTPSLHLLPCAVFNCKPFPANFILPSSGETLIWASSGSTIISPHICLGGGRGVVSLHRNWQPSTRSLQDGGLYCEGYPAQHAGLQAMLHRQHNCTRHRLQLCKPRCIYAAHAIPVFVRVKLSLHTNSNKQTKGQLVKLSILHIAGRASLTAFVKVHQKPIATGRMFV